MISFFGAFSDGVKILVTLISNYCFLQFLSPHIIALQYNNHFNYNLATVNSSFQFFSLFQTFSRLCILSHDNDLLESYISYIRPDYKPLVLADIEQVLTFKCESLLLLNLNKCSDLDILHIEKCQYSIHIFNQHPLFNMTDLNSCFASSVSPEVVFFSFQDNALFELSSVFSPPRRFIRTSVNQVLKHRVKRVQEDLCGVQVTGAFMFYPPFTIVPDGVDSPETFDGIEVLLFRQLSRQLNFTLRYLLFDNWGVVGDDGQWRSGVGQAMQQRTAQVAVANIWQFPSLYNIMDFGPPMTKAKLGFIVRRPEQIDFDWRSVIAIFKPKVWLLTLLLFVMTTVLYWFVINRGLSSYQRDWSCSVVAVFGHFVMTTSHDYRKDDSFSRYVLTSWSVFAVLLTSLLSSGIYCSIALPLYSDRVDSLRQLVEGGYYWTAQYYLRLNNEDIRRSMFNFQNRWQYLFEKKYKFLERSEVETQTYYDQKITFLVQTYGDDLVILDTEGLHGHSALKDFRMVEEVNSDTHITFGVEKNSPLLKPLSKMTIRFLEVGLLQHWKAAVIRRWPKHDTRHLLEELDDPTFSEPDVLYLKKLQPIFYLLLTGLSLSFVIFIVEIYWYYS